MRAERIALVDQHRLGAEALGDPVGEQQVRGHVVVDEPDPEDADVASRDERDRCGQRCESSGQRGERVERRARHRRREDRDGGEHENEERDRDRRPPPTPAADRAADDERHGESKRAGERRPLAPPAEGEHGLADDQRAADEQRRGGDRAGQALAG